LTFKDLIRLLRRRWLMATALFLASFAGFFVFSRVQEKPQYRARSKVLVSTPPVFLSTQGSQWITINNKDTATWISIIRSRRIVEPARERLQARGGVPAGAFDHLTATAEPGQQIIWIEAVAASPAEAAAVANAVAEALIQFASEDGRGQLTKARADVDRLIGEQQRIQQEHAAESRRLRDQARARLGVDNLELDVRKLQEDLLAQEGRRRDLERRASANRLRLERVSADRSAVEHLQRETLPRTASLQVRVSENARVRTLSERLEGQHRELLLLVRKYTEEHPQVKALRAEIRESQLELTRAQAQVLGQDMDAEELALRADGELVAIELRVLEPEIAALRRRVNELSPLLDETQRSERRAADGRTREESLRTLRDQLEAAPGPVSYVSSLEDARPEEAAGVELRLRRSWLVALFASALVGLSFAFLRDFLDTSIRSDYDVRRHLDFPVLAVVPRVSEQEVLMFRSAGGPLSEIYDTLATVLLSAPASLPSRLFLVTSPNPGDGKTSVSANLAAALARQGKRTLIVDGDLRRPSIHTALSVPNQIGFAHLLAAQAELGAEGMLAEIADVPNLSALPSGGVPENPYELLDPARIAAAAAQLRASFDAIVVDSPPVLTAGDALKLSGAADGVVFIVESGGTDQRQASWAKKLLANVGAKVAGAVLNKAARETEGYDYYGSYYRDRRGRVRREDRR
jgi:capsular exopolysaccharide synthesis family protein